MTKSQISNPKWVIGPFAVPSLRSGLRLRAGYWSLVIVLLAFALRVYLLDGQGFWSDEYLAVWRAQLPLAQMLTENMPAEHVPLYFVLLHFWLKVAGDTDFTVRFLPAAFSLLVIPLTYRLALEILDFRFWILDSQSIQNLKSKIQNPIGLLAAFLLAISPFQVWYAQENRMYSLLSAAGLASWVFLLRGLQRGGKWTWIGYIVATAAAIYTHYYAFLLVAAEVLFTAWWTIRHKADTWRAWLASMVAVAGLFLPWAPSATRLFTHRGWRPGADVLALPGRFVATYSAGTSMAPSLASTLTMGFVILFAIGAIACARRSSVAAWLLAFSLGVPLAGGMLLALRQPDFHERYFIFVTPVYLLAIAAGIAWLGRTMPILAALALLFVAGTDAYALYNHYFNPAFAKVDYRAVARYLEARVQPDDGIVPNGPEIGYVARYFRAELPPHYDNVAGEYFAQKGGADYVVPLLRDMAIQHPRVWMLWKWGGAEYVKDWFDQYGFQVQGEWVDDVRVYLYSFPTPTAATYHPVSGARTNGEILLAGYQIVPEYTPSGAVLNLALFWEPTARPARNYKTALRLVDPAGRTIATLDRPPLDGIVPTSAWIPGHRFEDRYGLQLPPGTPPVDHILQVKLYDPETSAEVLSVRLSPIPITRPARPPDPDRVPVQHRVRARLGDRVELVGYELPPDNPTDRRDHGQGFFKFLSVVLSVRGATPSASGVRPGETVPVMLLWRASPSPLPPSPPTPLPGGEGRAFRGRFFNGELAVHPTSPPTPPGPPASGGVGGTRELSGDFPQNWGAGEAGLGSQRADFKKPTPEREGRAAWESGWQARLTLIDPQGTEWSHTYPLSPTWPPEHWQSGDLIRAVYDLPIPAAATGDLRLAAALLDAAGNTLGTVPLGSLAVQVRVRQYQVPRISHPANVTLGGAARFLGYDLDREQVAPGGTLKLTLYWQAMGSGQAPVFDKNYTVFVHLLDASGAVRGQQDSPPLEGAAPTTSWLPGEVLADSYTVPVEGNAPRGDYIFEIGMYDPITGQRLPAFDAEGNPLPEDRILLDKVYVGEGR